MPITIQINSDWKMLRCFALLDVYEILEVT